MPLSISERIQLKREKRLRESRQDLAGKTGIVFSQELTAEKDGFPLMKYLINALILFCADFGSLYCAISAFEIKLSPGPLALTCAFFSLVLSFMYVRQRLKVITYLAILAGFLTVIFRYYNLVNSGVNALLNSVILYTDSRMKLPYLREFTVYYDDTFTAMTVAVCVIAVGLMILQNIMVSEMMSLRGLVFFTLPIAQLGMYFNFSSSKAGMFLVAVSWVLVEVIYLTGGYDGLTDKFTVSSSIKKHRHSYGFKTDSKNISRIAAIWLLFAAALTALVFAVVPEKNFEISIPVRDVKQESYRIAKNFMSYGTSSLFSGERKANSPGRLANVNSVSYDGLTDLEVELVNYRVNRMYLRSFTGYNYDSNQMRWLNYPGGDYENRFDLTYRLLKKDFETSQSVTQSRHRIGVKAVDPNVAVKELNIPYYASPAGVSGVKYTGPGSVRLSSVSESKAIYYDVYTVDEVKDYSALLENAKDDKELYEELKAALDEMKAEATEYALYVPEGNLPAIEQFCREYGIEQTDSDSVKIQKVTDAFQSDYEYTLRPGKVPQEEDYINYFLVANKRGYCQHFASAAVLIFRYLGIPARYAEGYAIDREDFYTSEVVYTDDISQWITSPYRVDTNVSRVSVPDSNGHAWVEIFRDGFGWEAAEVTAGVSQDGGRSFLGTLFQMGQRSDPQGAAEIIGRLNMNGTPARLALLGIIILLILLLYYLAAMAVKVVPRHIAFRKGGGKSRLAGRYRHLYDAYRYASGETGELSYSEFFALCGEDGEAFAGRLEKALFSGNESDGDEIEPLCGGMNARRKEIVRAMPFVRRLRYYLVDFMW